MQKVTLDLHDLLRKGVIDPPLAEELARHGQSFTLNAGIQFGIGILVCGLVAAAIMLDPEFRLVPIWATCLMIGGIAGVHKLDRDYRLFAHTATAIGTLAFSGWIWFLLGRESSPQTIWLLIAVLNLGVGIVSGNSLLIGCAVLATTPIVNMRTEYDHASYALIVERPLRAAVAYGALAAMTGATAFTTRGWVQRLAWVAFGVSLFIANEAMWVGSLWGDPDLVSRDEPYRSYEAYSSIAVLFALAWAALSIVSAAC
jgi:hypothetical protein